MAGVEINPELESEPFCSQYLLSCPGLCVARTHGFSIAHCFTPSKQNLLPFRGARGVGWGQA